MRNAECGMVNPLAVSYPRLTLISISTQRKVVLCIYSLAHSAFRIPHLIHASCPIAFLSGRSRARNARPAVKDRANMRRKKFSLGIFSQNVPRYPDR